MKIIVTSIPTDLVTSSLLCSFCSFLQTKNKKAMPNSIDFYKGIFLHIISVRIILPWSELSQTRLA